MNQKSIYRLKPKDTSGRHAKSGFIYQDHIGAKFCIEMLIGNEIEEVWIEREDDITLVLRINGNIKVEFVQVKHYESKPSRWSFSDLCSRKNDRKGTSLVEKMLSQDRCSEDTCFRFVSSFDIKKDDLGFLKLPKGTQSRLNEPDKRRNIIKELSSRLGSIQSPNGKRWNDFVDDCFWEKSPDNIENLKASNLINFERVISTQGLDLLPDQRDELYQKLLALVQNLSTCDLTKKEEGYKITKRELERWFVQTSRGLLPISGTSKLDSKLKVANIPDETISSAIDLRIKFKSERLNYKYSRQSDISNLESEILYKLHSLKVKLDNGVINMTGQEFHNLCMDEIEKIVNKPIYQSINIPEYIGVGCMYDITNRCSHRFIKATP